MNMSDHPIDTHKFYHFQPPAESINIPSIYSECVCVQDGAWECAASQDTTGLVNMYDQNDDRAPSY